MLIRLVGLALLFMLSNSVYGSDEELLRNLKTKLWPQAYRTQDVTLLDSILHQTFEMIDAEGGRSNKEKELQYIKDNKWDPGEFEYVIERLEIYDGRFAIVDGTGMAEKYSYKSSNVLIKENGAWRAIASHVSGYKEND